MADDTERREGNVFSDGPKKVLLFPDRIRRWRDERPFEPVVVEIHPSERCNHRCPDCQSRWILGDRRVSELSRRGQFMDLTILNGLWERPPEGIIISGQTGEPLMHPKIGELLLILEKRSMPYVMITNGGRMTRNLAEILVRSSRGIRVSLDGYDLASFRSTHGVGKNEWKRVLQGIELLVEARRGAGVSRKSCLIGLGYLVGPATKDGMERVTCLASGLGVDYIHFRPFHFTDVTVDDQIDSCLAYARTDFSVLISGQKYHLMMDGNWMNDRPYSICHGAFFYSMIDPHGDIYVCCHHVGNERAKVGSLREGLWSDWLDSPVRRESIRKFGLTRCVPLCRLNALNRVLQALLDGQRLDPPTDSLVLLHRMFL